MNDRKIFRSIDDYMIAGVCGGLADYFKIDSSIVRIIFVLLALGGGCGVLVYLILWLVIPKEKGIEKEIDREEKLEEFVEDVKGRAKSMAKEIKIDTKIKKPGKNINILGIILIMVGIVAIWNQISPIEIQWNLFWPGLLILVGILVLFRK
ncbi:MAG: PspC domain-containing protein [Candidatus Shapirobacteria bacterium]|nr:PspC domain-containing protein [Candidatus Shapirobacteria bacterium]MDD4410164.1 PspC domain-containing protein [Candidatus Shapirobacteria bacterium]